MCNDEFDITYPVYSMYIDAEKKNKNKGDR